MEQFVLLLSPFAPHIAEELWQKLGHETSLAYVPWPAFDAEKAKLDVIEVVLQVNGKLRGKIHVAPDTDEATLSSMAATDSGVQKFLEGKTVVKTVVVKNRLVNYVVK
jgi:leucyl-tRNA synthetase